MRTRTLLLALLLAAAPAAAQTPFGAPADDGTEGIHVSGDWTIVVREPDGTLVEQREFHNALTEKGAGRLADYLARTWTVGLWEVRLYGSTLNEGPCFDTAPSFCVITEPGHPFNGQMYFKNLTVEAPATGEHAGRLVLQGNIEAQRDGIIGIVRTHNVGCSASLAPDDCTGQNLPPGSPTFTAKTLTTPITVTDGQLVQVEVVIGFN